ncbi:unnamed protein product, partial [Gulo gulo]
MVMLHTGTNSTQERPLKPSSMILKVDPQWSVNDFLALGLATLAPLSSLVSRLRMRLIITAHHGTRVSMVTQCSGS